MSDYLFTTSKQLQGALAENITAIYESAPPLVKELHGEWGTLAFSQGHYRGFTPYETEQHIMVVIGGPVLYFHNNDFLVEDDSNTASKAIYKRWIIERKIQWDEDLSGPFTILLIDKKNKTYQVVTDLMSFIPVYVSKKENNTYIGTHIDALALSCDEQLNVDKVSLTDFILNDVITYPYTAYCAIKQLAPACVVKFENNHKSLANEYWQAIEKNEFHSLNNAANELRNGIQGYVERVSAKMTKVAQFISGGEDSRVISGVLSPALQRDGYVFLDRMNREGKIAKKVAGVYDINFNVGYRKSSHYIDMLPEASKLVGNGQPYFHAQSLNFDKTYKLSEYSAVFGGFLSDTLLKGHHIKLFKGYYKVPFCPQIESRKHDPVYLKMNLNSQYFNSKHIDEVIQRRKKHLERLRVLRPNTYKEWFTLWPISMYCDMPNLYSSRRLFKSYEPFMCKEAVKISAAAPKSWKLNRILFNKAMKPYLKKSKWLPHADGRLPYFSWYINAPIQFGVWLYRHAALRLGLIKGHQGPWGDWKSLLAHEKWRTFVKNEISNKHLYDMTNTKLDELLLSNKLRTTEKLNLLQVLFTMGGKGNSK